MIEGHERWTITERIPVLILPFSCNQNGFEFAEQLHSPNTTSNKGDYCLKKNVGR